MDTNNQENIETPQPSKKFNKLILVGIVLVIGIIGFFPFIEYTVMCIQAPCPPARMSLFQWFRYRDNLKQTPVNSNLQTYINTDYGFQLTLPASWEGYRVIKQEMGSNFGSGSVVFRVPTKSTIWTDRYGNDGYATVMTISIFNSSYWDKLQSEEGPKPGLLGKDGDLVYAYSFWQDTPDDWTNKLFTSQEIVSTFKFLR